MAATDAMLVAGKSRRILQPPLGFAQVDNGIYRSAYPSKKTLQFVETLKLRSMVCLTPSDVRQELEDFVVEKEIALLKCPVQHNQEPFLVMSEENIRSILRFVAEEKNQPTLIFCTNGKVRTGCVVACIRRSFMRWCMSSTIAEFEQFAEPEGSLCDLHFIESFTAPDLQQRASFYCSSEQQQQQQPHQEQDQAHPQEVE